MQIVVIIVLLVVAVAGYFFIGGSKNNIDVADINLSVPAEQRDVETGANVNQNTKNNLDTNIKVDLQKYKDGTYTQKGVYNSPAGSESVNVTVTVKDGVVTNSTFKGEATNKASIFNQQKFADGFTGMVVGKPIDSIALTVVNGSSLTPTGFMDALNKIKSQAKM